MKTVTDIAQINTTQNALSTVWLAWGAIGLWFLALLLVCASLMVSHWVTLPLPAKENPLLANAIKKSRAPEARHHWYAVHFLYSQCNCSKRVVEHLFQRQQQSSIKELLVLVGNHPEWEREARENDFPFIVISQSELKKRFNITAAPIMVVSGPDDRIYYAGAYTERKQGYQVQDREIISQLQNNRPIAALPLFGCAVAKQLQQLLDPIGLKYFPDKPI